MSHHSETPKDAMRLRELTEALKKMDGQHPHGKLTKDDEGVLAMGVGVENGAVVINFHKPVAWIGFDPDQAVEMALTIIKHARSIGLKKPFTVEL